MIVTTTYVIFTYRLMRAATQTAKVALEQPLVAQLEKWTPLQIAVDDALPKLNSWLSKHEKQPFPDFVADPSNRAAANFPHLLNAVLMSSTQLSGAVFAAIREAADNIQQVVIHTDKIWPYSAERRSDGEEHFAAAVESARIAKKRLEQAKAIIDSAVGQLSKSLPSA